MKTPDEIKKGLLCCSHSDMACRECPYDGLCNTDSGETPEDDAVGLIDQLLSSYSQLSKVLCGKENATFDELLQAVSQVKERLAQAERERDAAVADLKSIDEKYESLKSMIDDVTFNHEPYGLYLDFREAADAMIEHEHADVWRGVCPENTKEELT